MFDREDHIKKMKLVHSSWSQEQFEKDADLMEKKFSRIKRGDKVVHIRYIGSLLTDEDLKDIEAKLSVVNYELSSFDEAGITKASNDNFISEVILYLNDYTLQQTLLSGLLTNAIWDIIKSISFYTWHKIKSKTYLKATSTTVSESKASFSLKTSTLEFKIDNLSEETFGRSLDKILDFLKEESSKVKGTNIDPARSKIAVYNQNSNEWEIITLTPEMMKLSNDKIIKTMSIEEFVKSQSTL
jgi:hypothetical protein